MFADANSTLSTRAARAGAALALALAATAPALAQNHALVMQPIPAGPFAVACSNVAQDPALIAQLGSTPAEIWEGRPNNGAPRYITQVLSAPTTAVRFAAPVPDLRSLYPQFAGALVEHVAIVCHPTPRANPDPDYVLPGTTDVVPRMQPAGASPRLIHLLEYASTLGVEFSPPPPDVPARLPFIVFSHGLGGSPLGTNYLSAMADLASHGYMVGAVFHADSRFSRIRIEDLGGAIQALLEFDRFVEMELMRPVSLKAMLDTLLAHPGFAPGIDADRIGGFGASMGGQAMANLVGARLTTSLGLRCSETVRDPRIKAVVGLVPYAGQTFLPAFCDDQSGADDVTRPFLAIAGTADTTAPIKMAEQAVNRMPASHYLVALDGVPHDYRPEYRGDVMTWTTNFLDAYLGVQFRADAMRRLIRMASVAGGPVDTLRVDVHVPFARTGEQSEIVEFFNELTGHYFVTGRGFEADLVLAGGAGPGWHLTGESFKAYPRASQDAPTASPVCRFYGSAVGPNSHFYTVSPLECAQVKANPDWRYEGISFFALPQVGAGGCREGELQVLRAYNRREAQRDGNHRFTTSDSTWREMGRKGWLMEGVAFCAPP